MRCPRPTKRKLQLLCLVVTAVSLAGAAPSRAESASPSDQHAPGYYLSPRDRSTGPGEAPRARSEWDRPVKRVEGWGDEGSLLRVCADPNNMPFSNRKGEGFENNLAELVASELGMSVAYTWRPQRRGFVRDTLNAHKCDVIMGIPKLETIATTRSYYRSGYVFVSRADRNLSFGAIDAPELKDLRVGVHLIGDDGSNTPPSHALAQQGIVNNVVGYSIYGDYREDSPPLRLLEAVERGEVDIAAVWGPLAGYYAKKSGVPLRLEPITGAERYLPLVFHFSISMGVRKYEDELLDKLNEVILTKRAEIRAILEEYGVPLL
jgi:mxaJ protein